MSRVIIVLFVLAFILGGGALAEGQDVVRAEVAKRIKQSTVLVEAAANKTVGAAFCVSERGYFLTCKTVARGNVDTVKLTVRPGLESQKEYRAKIVRSDRDSDLALLRILGDEKFTPLPLGFADGLTELAPIIVAGYQREKKLSPEDEGIPPLSLMAGQISALAMKNGELHRIQTDVAINSPGGPVVDDQGRVIGVLSSELRTPCSAIPIAEIRRFLSAPILDPVVPVVKFAERHQPVTFAASAVEILPTASLLQLQLIVESGMHEPVFERSLSHTRSTPMAPAKLALPLQQLPMYYQQGQFVVKTPPVLPAQGVRTLIAFPNGVIEGYVPDELVRIGKREFRLSELRTLRFGLTPSATVDDEKEPIVGTISGLKPWTIAIGGDKVKVEPEKALEIRIAPPEQQTHVLFRIVASRDGKEVGSVRDSIRFIDGPRPDPKKSRSISPDLDGKWILEGAEENGENWPVRNEEGIRIDGDKFVWIVTEVDPTNRAPTSGRLIVDVTKSPKTIDLVVQGSQPGVWQGIWQIEGEKLILAINRKENRRPQQFTTRLAAGVERATFLRTYRKADVPQP